MTAATAEPEPAPALDIAHLRGSLLLELRAAVWAQTVEEDIRCAELERRVRAAASLPIPKAVAEGDAILLRRRLFSVTAPWVPSSDVLQAIADYLVKRGQIDAATGARWIATDQALSTAIAKRRGVLSGAARSDQSELLTCPECGSEKRVKRSAVDTWRACSRRCQAFQQQKGLTAWNALQRALLSTVKRRKQDKQPEPDRSPIILKELVAATGVSHDSLRDWFDHEGSTLMSPNLARVAAAVEKPVPVDEALRMAGGRTQEMVAAEFIKTARPDPKTEADRFRSARRKAKKTRLNNRIDRSLAEHLQEQPNPTTEAEIRTWAAATARLLHTNLSVVLKRWQAPLKQRGLPAPRPAGRPADNEEQIEAICAQLIERRKRWTCGTADIVGGRFFDWAGPDMGWHPDSLKRFDRDHRKTRCPRALDAAANMQRWRATHRTGIGNKLPKSNIGSTL